MSAQGSSMCAMQPTGRLTDRLTGAVCGTDEPACTEMCYVNGAGFIIAIVIQSVNFVCCVYSAANMIWAMPIVVDYYKNKQGLFQWSEYDPASHLSIQVDSFKASLIYDINREKKSRIWAPFWDGLFEEARSCGHEQQNSRCCCKFDGGMIKCEYRRNPDCPVSTEASVIIRVTSVSCLLLNLSYTSPLVTGLLCAVVLLPLAACCHCDASDRYLACAVLAVIVTAIFSSACQHR